MWKGMNLNILWTEYFIMRKNKKMWYIQILIRGKMKNIKSVTTVVTVRFFTIIKAILFYLISDILFVYGF